MFFCTHCSFGQPGHYEGYYQFPIKPGMPNYLSGTFGEIRSSHFHTGIDIKTGRKIGLPVYAAAGGHISRIKVSTRGYGKVLYIAHPNETFSVYAHLDAFEKSISQYVLEEQYDQQLYEVELFPEKNQFYLEKGQLIGYSGNTGSSVGPHLHFEIRDRDQRPMNALTFGFSEVSDFMAPVVAKIAFVALDKNARINNLFGRYEFDLVEEKNIFRMNEPVRLEGRIGVEIYSYDPMDNVPNKNGIVKTVMMAGSDTLFYENKRLLTFERQRNVLKHYNYEASVNGSRRFHKLYLDDGNEHDIYLKTNKGIIFTGPQKLRIITEDSYHNISITKVNINYTDLIHPLETKIPSFERMENIMHFKSNTKAEVKTDIWRPVKAYYSDGEQNYYLWDMSEELPSDIYINNNTVKTHLITSIPPEQTVSCRRQSFEANFGNRSLFDTLYLAFRKKMDSDQNIELFQFQNHKDPIRSNISVTLRPERIYDYEKSFVYSVSGRRFSFIGGRWQGGAITFKTRRLAVYTILTDNFAPKIKPVSISNKKLQFKITDNLSGIKDYAATINNEFLLMGYEPKQKLIWSITKEPDTLLKGELILKVTDNADNQKIYKQIL